MPLNQISLFSQDWRNPHMVHCTTPVHSNHTLHKHHPTCAIREGSICSQTVLSQNMRLALRHHVVWILTSHIICSHWVSNSLVVSIKLCMYSIPQMQACCHKPCTLPESCSTCLLPMTNLLRLATNVHQAGDMRQCQTTLQTCRYPNNFVLRLLTPQDTCIPLDIYPIKLTQDAIYVDVGAAASSRAYQTTRGGADSSIERNNVYALQPKSYIQGQDPSGDCSCRGMSLCEIPLALVPVSNINMSITVSITSTSSNTISIRSISTSTSDNRLEEKTQFCHCH